MSDSVVVRVPKPATLARYGLSEREWRGMLFAQGGVCAVCQRVPPSGGLCVDHRHIKGWKKMIPAERRRYVRGLLCARCNHQFVCRGITIALSEAVTAYLKLHESLFNKEGKS